MDIEDKTVVSSGEGIDRGWTESLELTDAAVIFGMDVQQGPTV